MAENRSSEVAEDNHPRFPILFAARGFRLLREEIVGRPTLAPLTHPSCSNDDSPMKRLSVSCKLGLAD